MQIQRVLCPIDFSKTSTKALHYAAAEQGVRDMLEALGVALPVVRPAVRDGAAVGAIVAYAREEQIDLTVMGTHGSTGLDHMLFGSVAERVLHYAPCPVLAIPPAASDIDVATPGRHTLLHVLETLSENEVRFARVLCACDFSGSSARRCTLPRDNAPR